MNTNSSRKVIAPLILVTSLILSLIPVFSSVGTIKASTTIFSDDFATAVNADAQYDSWNGGGINPTVNNTLWKMLSSTGGGPKQGLGELGLLPNSSTATEPFIISTSFATTGYNDIRISFDWARRTNTNDTRLTTVDAWWSTDGTNWTIITGTHYDPETDGWGPIHITNVLVSSDYNVGNKPTVYIKWKTNGRGDGSGSSRKIAFDNVVITGTLGGGVTVNVTISPSENSGMPETTLTYTVVLNNTGPSADNYILTVGDNENWDPTLDDNQFLNVGAGENGTTTLRVTVPVDVADGVQDLITVTATSQENENIKDNDTCKAISYLVPAPEHYKAYAIDDQVVMEGKGNLSENYPFKLPTGTYHLENCPRERSFLKFDLSSIPPGASIENAYLGLYHHFGVYIDGRWVWVEVWTVENDSWTENVIDWSNQPPKVENLYHEYIDYISYSPNPWLGTINGWPGVPVTSYIQNEIADGAASFVLYSPQEDVAPADNTDVDFTATEDENYSTQWPYLEVWYYENAPQVLFSASISPSSQTALPGDNLVYTVMVNNNGTINDNYNLVVSDNAVPSWGPTLNDNLFLNVEPGENRTTTLRVTIPENVDLGTHDKITVTATSQADNRLSESADAIAATSSGENWVVASNAPYVYDYGVAVVGAKENIYILNSISGGGTSNIFMRYNTATDQWTTTAPPQWPKNGSALAWDNGNYIYALFGGSYSDTTRHYFYRYNISSGSWGALQVTPGVSQGAGDAIAWVPGSALGDNDNYIFAIVGKREGGANFLRYSISGGSWTQIGTTWDRNSFPGETDDGCSLVWTGGKYLYFLRGEDYESPSDGLGIPVYDFLRYDIENNIWTRKENIPAPPHDSGGGGVGDGGSLLWIGGDFSDYIYALSGNQYYPEPIYDNRFYRYKISTDNWIRLADMPGGVGDQNGQRLGFANISSNKIYAWKGCNGDSVLWVYTVQPDEIIRSVSVSITPSDKYGITGDNLNYNVSVTNTGNVSDSYTLNLTGTIGWTRGGLPASTGSIAAGDNWTGQIWVVVGGSPDNDNLTVTATSVGNVSVSGSATCYAHFVLKGVDVSITPSTQNGLPGDNLTYTVTVQNIGASGDNYDLTVNDSLGWGASVDDAVLSVPVSENRTTTLRVTISLGAVLGQTDTITVTATSQTDITVKDNYSVTAIYPIVRTANVSVSPSDKYGWLGDNLVFDITVVNTGNVPDNYQLSLTDTLPWLAGWDAPSEVTGFIYASTPENTIKSTDDGGVVEGNPDTNNGHAYNMYVGRGSTYLTEWAYFKFPLSSIPAGAVIDNAYLYAGCGFGPSHAPGNTADNMWVEAWNVDNDSWNEWGIGDNLTWNHRPVPDGTTLLDNVHVIASVWIGYNHMYSWNVSSYVASQFAGDNVVSIRLASNGIGDSGAENNAGWFYTRDNETHNPGGIMNPYLKVYYHLFTGMENSLSLNVGENWTGTFWVVVNGASGTSDKKTVTATSMTDNLIKGSASSWAHSALGGVSVSITPSYENGSPGDNLNYTVTVTNTGPLTDNIVIIKSDTLSWTMSLDNTLFSNVPSGENRSTTLHVTVGGSGVDNITLMAGEQGAGQIDFASCTAEGTGAGASVDLVAGWNLVCFTAVGASDTPTNLFTGLTYYMDYYLYWWTAPGGPYNIQNPDTVLLDNIAYWVYINTAKTVSTTGTRPTSRDVYNVPGWNMLGFPVVDAGTTPTNVYAPLDYYTDYYLYWWTAPGGPYSIQDPDTPLLDNTGYWVYINTIKTVTVP